MYVYIYIFMWVVYGLYFYHKPLRLTVMHIQVDLCEDETRASARLSPGWESNSGMFSPHRWAMFFDINGGFLKWGYSYPKMDGSWLENPIEMDDLD